MWREGGQIFPTSGAQPWAACTSPEETTPGVVDVSCCRGNPAKEPRSDIIPGNRRVSTCSVGTMQMNPSVGAFLEFSSYSQLPPILLSRAGQCWDTGFIAGVAQSRRRSINPFPNRRWCWRGSHRGCVPGMLSGWHGILEALPAPALPAACSCRDWANWESPAAGSAPRGWDGFGSRQPGRGSWWSTGREEEGRTNGSAEKSISTI